MLCNVIRGSRDEYKGVEVDDLELEDFSKLLIAKQYDASLIEFADLLVDDEKNLLNEMFRRFKKYQAAALVDFLDYYLIIDEDFSADFVAFLKDKYCDEFIYWRDYGGVDFDNYF